jgi:glucose-6-phosphate isomerase
MLGWEGDLPQPSVRTIGEMRPVLADPSCDCDDPLYFMYRDVTKSDADWRWLRENKLRYDITVIPAKDVCGEWVKTKGHYHPENPAGVGYPEIYEVIEGLAHYILQSRSLDDIVMVTATAGDIVIIPPGYGHISINPSPVHTLVMANIVSTAFESEYGEFETYHGAAYYEMCSGTLQKNPHYPFVPPVRHLVAGSGRGEQRVVEGPLYSMIGNRDALAFLNNPEDYRTVLAALLTG